MGRKTSRSRRLKPLSPQAEMRGIAQGLGLHQAELPTDRDGMTVLDRLAQQPLVHRRFMGRSAERVRRDFATAYPGQTRTRRFSNAQWCEAGYPHVARLNELLGLRSS